MKYSQEDPDRRMRTRLDFLIALMVVQIVLSIGLWVDFYRDRGPENKEVATTESKSSLDELYSEEYSDRSSNSEPAYTEPVSSAPVTESQSQVPSKIKMQVLNGCNKQGLANKAKKWLTNNDYDVIDVGNADRANYTSTEIYNRSGNATAARDLARLLGIDESKIRRKTAPPGMDVDLTLILGSDYKKMPFGK